METVNTTDLFPNSAKRTTGISVQSVPFVFTTPAIHPSQKRTSVVQTTDVYISEKEDGDARTKSLTRKPLPSAQKFDIMGLGKDGKAEKKKSMLVEHEHSPAGRWSDPFTTGWRGSIEAEEGTRYKGTKSWAQAQNKRLDDLEIGKKEGKGMTKEKGKKKDKGKEKGEETSRRSTAF